MVSWRNRTWWWNLGGGSPVTLRLQGHDVKGWVTVVEDDPGLAAGLSAHLRQAPHYARYYGVTLDANEQPNRADVARAAQSKVMVQVKLA